MSRKRRRTHIDDPEVRGYLREQELERLMSAPDTDIGSKEGALWTPPNIRKRDKSYPKETDK